MTNLTRAFDYGIRWKEVIVSLTELRMAVDGEKGRGYLVSH